MSANRKDDSGTRELIKQDATPAETTQYYAYKGNGEWVDENGQHRVSKLNDFCCAFSTGKRLELRLSDNGEFINPNGLPQRNKAGRFIPVTETCFGLYLRFLKTGQEKYLLQAKRELV